jgi:uncharacterized protein (UPF0248 family)
MSQSGRHSPHRKGRRRFYLFWGDIRKEKGREELILLKIEQVTSEKVLFVRTIYLPLHRIFILTVVNGQDRFNL